MGSDSGEPRSTASVSEIAAAMGLDPHLLDPYGHDVAKVSLDALTELADRPRGKYVLVTAITPTPLGEGKTATAIGLAEALTLRGHRATVTIRQAAMGPVFGIKGGAGGAGRAQVVPIDRVNLHLTGDMHAVTAAHNLLAAMVDNHVYQGNELGLDPHSITWGRALDVNDRSLRHVVTGLGGRTDGVPHQTGFSITAASEVMAILALATSLKDLRTRLGRIIVGYDTAGNPVTAEQLHAAGSMAVLLREALKPNLMRTVEGSPALIHAGPFGNIAHGCSSIVADLIALRTSDFVITEAGFGADLGAEKFFDIKCRASGLTPDAVVVVATVRALKLHSGRHVVKAGRPLPDGLFVESVDDVTAGADNLLRHLDIVSGFGAPAVVAINAFPTDHASEHAAIADIAARAGVRAVVTTAVADGGQGGNNLAEAIEKAAASAPGRIALLYPDDLPLAEKIRTVATRVYGAEGVDFTPSAARSLERLETLGFGSLPVCMAKTHLSLSHDPTLLGAPDNWRLPVTEVRVHAGAGFVYALCGDMQTMPGLGRNPAAMRIDLDDDGKIVGLF